MALVLSGGLMFASCGSQETNDAVETPLEEPAMEAEINTTHAYVCPMDCENSASMEPGQCPVCGMDLVANPNFAGAADGSMNENAGEEGTHGHDHTHDDHEGHNH